jgi:hypothetical protein
MIDRSVDSASRRELQQASGTRRKSVDRYHTAQYSSYNSYSTVRTANTSYTHSCKYMQKEVEAFCACLFPARCTSVLRSMITSFRIKFSVLKLNTSIFVTHSTPRAAQQQHPPRKSVTWKVHYLRFSIKAVEDRVSLSK